MDNASFSVSQFFTTSGQYVLSSLDGVFLPDSTMQPFGSKIMRSSPQINSFETYILKCIMKRTAILSRLDVTKNRHFKWLRVTQNHSMMLKMAKHDSQLPVTPYHSKQNRAKSDQHKSTNAWSTTWWSLIPELLSKQKSWLSLSLRRLAISFLLLPLNVKHTLHNQTL